MKKAFRAVLIFAPLLCTMWGIAGLQAFAAGPVAAIVPRWEAFNGEMGCGIQIQQVNLVGDQITVRRKIIGTNDSGRLLNREKTEENISVSIKSKRFQIAFERLRNTRKRPYGPAWEKIIVEIFEGENLILQGFGITELWEAEGFYVNINIKNGDWEHGLFGENKRADFKLNLLRDLSKTFSRATRLKVGIETLNNMGDPGTVGSTPNFEWQIELSSADDALLKQDGLCPKLPPTQLSSDEIKQEKEAQKAIVSNFLAIFAVGERCAKASSSFSTQQVGCLRAFLQETLSQSNVSKEERDELWRAVQRVVSTMPLTTRLCADARKEAASMFPPEAFDRGLPANPFD